MATTAKHDLRTVSRQFRFEGDYVDGTPYGTGHINDTYCVRCGAGPNPRRYILQRVNHKIFKDVPRLRRERGHGTQGVRATICT